MRKQFVVHRFKHSPVPFCITIDHGASGRALLQSQIGYESGIHRNGCAYIGQYLAFIELSEHLRDQLIIRLILTAEFIALMSGNTALQYEIRYQFQNLFYNRLLVTFIACK